MLECRSLGIYIYSPQSVNEAGLMTSLENKGERQKVSLKLILRHTRRTKVNTRGEQRWNYYHLQYMYQFLYLFADLAPSGVCV